MPEWRKDPIIERWVVIAPNRGARPHDVAHATTARSAGPCPFCEGNEEETTQEIAACRESGTQENGPGWRVRVVPNKYPALTLNEATPPSGDAFHQAMPGLGAHEVIVESPRHVRGIVDLSEDHFREVLEVYRRRLLELRTDPRLLYAAIFKNVGEAAGASLEHAHSQLIALPLVPRQVRDELAAALALYRQRGRCAYCELLEVESAAAARVVLQTPHFVALCPYASRFAYETWVLPRRHASRFESIAPAAEADLAGVLQQVVGRMENLLDYPAYNYLVRTAPLQEVELPHDHWRIEVFPRLAKTAGFEWGTDVFINTVSPETAAARLREATPLRAAALETAAARC